MLLIYLLPLFYRHSVDISHIAASYVNNIQHKMHKLITSFAKELYAEAETIYGLYNFKTLVNNTFDVLSVYIDYSLA